LETGFDESIAAADTFTAVTLLLAKPITVLRGWEDSEAALAAAAELLPFARYAETVKFFDLGPVFWGSIADVKALAGKTEESEALAKEKLGGSALRRRQTMFLVHAARGDDRAVAFADSLLSDAPLYTRGLVHTGLGEMFLARGETDRALEELRAAQKIVLPLGARPYLYPRSLYLMGLAYERKGDTREAAAAYERLLRMWKNADRDLVTLRETRARLAALKRAATQ
jgi:tetratricopeptide (TPR) repeat protein